MNNNMEAMDTRAFRSDLDLTRELIVMEYGSKVKQPIGVPPVPEQMNCHFLWGETSFSQQLFLSTDPWYCSWHALPQVLLESAQGMLICVVLWILGVRKWRTLLFRGLSEVCHTCLTHPEHIHNIRSWTDVDLKLLTSSTRA